MLKYLLDAVCLRWFPSCHDLQVVKDYALSSALAGSPAISSLPKIPLGLKPDFIRSLDDYLKIVAIIRISRLKTSKPRDGPC